ncbi:MAG TPA: hypothetical protein PLA71_00985 [Saccharofermentans sp.]|nr:hypothetical protein [Saccharofermentans sp.]
MNDSTTKLKKAIKLLSKAQELLLSIDWTTDECISSCIAQPYVSANNTINSSIAHVGTLIHATTHLGKSPAYKISNKTSKAC